MIFKVNIIDLDFRSQIPMEVQLRLRLEEMGMKFEDSGKPSAIVNLNPKPLGRTRSWINYADPDWKYFEQKL